VTDACPRAECELATMCASSRASIQKLTSSVLDRRRGRIFHLVQSITATKYKEPRYSRMWVTSAHHTWVGLMIWRPPSIVGAYELGAWHPR
jgi:hypothetical protein